MEQISTFPKSFSTFSSNYFKMIVLKYKMSVQDFFVMAKPDAVERGLVGEIISRFEKKGFKLKTMRFLYPTQTANIIPVHYDEHSEKGFYNDLIKFSLSGP